MMKIHRNSELKSSLGRLLIVDDKANLLTALCETLADMGYETMGFVMAKEALEVLKEQSFDLMLTDLKMPEMDGITLLREALQIDPNLVTIIMTGHGATETAVEAMKLGALDYVLKPFKLNLMMPVLSRAMEVRRLRMENIQLNENLAIYELSMASTFDLDRNTILNKMAEAIIEGFKADELSVMLPTKDGNELFASTVRSENRDHILGYRMPVGQGIAGWVAQHKEAVTLQGEVDDPRFAPIHPRPEIRSSISVPILAGGKVLGVLNVNALRRSPFTPGDVKALNILVNIAGSALENARMYEQVKERTDELVKANEELDKHREHLEELVKERTAELTKANQHLRQQIEERKRAEEALRESENGLAEAQRIAHMGNWDLDLVKNELRWSDEIYRIFGLKPQEFGATYEAFLNTVHPDDREFVDTSYTKSVKSNTQYDIVHRIVRPDGEVRYVYEKAEVIKDETGKTIRSIGTVQDITERKEAEDALKKSTAELQIIVNAMAGREMRMAELKETIRELRAQLEEEGLTPVADDPLREAGRVESEE